MNPKQSCLHSHTNRYGYCTKCNFQTRMSIEDARKELNSLLVSGENNNRLEELKRRLDCFYLGNMLKFNKSIVY